MQFLKDSIKIHLIIFKHLEVGLLLLKVLMGRMGLMEGVDWGWVKQYINRCFRMFIIWVLLWLRIFTFSSFFFCFENLKIFFKKCVFFNQNCDFFALVTFWKENKNLWKFMEQSDTQLIHRSEPRQRNYYYWICYWIFIVEYICS